MRQLLYDLEADFDRFSGSDQMLDVTELADVWKKCAERRTGKLSGEEMLIIEKSSRDCFKALDIDSNRKIGYDEFMTYMMGGAEERGPMKDMRTKLNRTLRQDASKLKRLIEQFKIWDKNGDGWITKSELEQHLVDLEDIYAQPNLRRDHCRALETTRSMVDRLVKEADVDADGRVDLWEFIAHSMGRRKMAVELMLYDISHGVAKALGPLLIGRKVEAVHSAVLVFGSEYWYGGNIFRSDPPCDACFGPPLEKSLIPLQPSSYKLELYTAHIGYTFATHEEFNDFLVHEMVPKYNGVERYDLLTHSCNHFSNDVIRFLTGGHVPDKVLELQNIAQTPALLALRPFLNKYFGGFGDAGKDSGSVGFTTDTNVEPEHSHDSICYAVLGEGSVVIISEEHEGGFGVIVREEDDTCTVKVFDPSTGDMVLKVLPHSALEKIEK